MKKVAIVGLGWLGMPLAMSLAAKGWQVTGSKTTRDGVEAAGAFSCVHAPLEDPNVFQHTSPERLVRMMVMMVVFKLNACHINSR